jgi:hypothetical protein
MAPALRARPAVIENDAVVGTAERFLDALASVVQRIGGGHPGQGGHHRSVSGYAG